MKKRILLFSLIITIAGIVLISLLYTGIFWQSRVADSERYLEIYSSVAEAELAESGVSQERVEAVSARLSASTRPTGATRSSLPISAPCSVSADSCAKHSSHTPMH